MKKTFNKYTVQRIDEPDFTFASFGKTPEQALQQCSGSERCKIISTEQIPYLNADLYAAIAECLPGKWDAEPQSYEHANCAWYFTRADGLKLHISPPCYNHKNAFQVSLWSGRSSGQFYVEIRENGHRVNYPSVNIGAGKSAEQVAKDIARRLLPEAERVNGLVNAQIAKEQTEADLRLATLKDICAAFGVPVPHEFQDKTRPRFSGSAGDCDFEVTYGGNVTLKLSSVPLATARKVAAALRK